MAIQKLAIVVLVAWIGIISLTSAATIVADYVVIGGGGAGSIVASLLANATNRPKVLVLERGSAANARLDQGIDALIPNPHWHDQPYFFPIPQEFAMGPPGRQPHFASQYAMGGSTRIFGCVNNRASKKWVETRLPAEYNFTVMLNNYKANEDHYCHYRSPAETGISVADCLAYHGKGGPMKIAFPSLQHISAPMKAFLQTAANEPGYGFTNDYNNPNTRAGFAWEQHFRALDDPTNATSSRSRVSTWNAWLSAAFRASHRNLEIRTGAFVDKLLVSNKNQVRGARFVQDGETHLAFARKEVFLSAGVLHTPQILQLAGIGPKDLLVSMGIPLRAENNHVGQNLHVHQGLFNAYRLNQNMPNDKRFHGVGVGAAHLKSSFTNLPADIQLELLEGVYAETSAGFESGPAFEIVSTAATSPPPTDPNVVSFPFLGIVIINDEPMSKGSVNITSTSPLDRPQMDYGWTVGNISPVDDLKLAEAYSLVRALVMGNNTFNSTYQPVEVYPDARWRNLVAAKFGITTEPLLSTVSNVFYRRYSIQPFYHATSTCALGKCTDVDGRVKGVTGLTVCDNSLLPEHPDANPTTAMMALCTEVVRRALVRTARNNFEPNSVAAEARNW